VNAAGVADARSRLREFALSFPGAWEDFPWGESVVKVGRKVFVFLGSERSERPMITVKLDESHGHALSIAGAERTAYGLGRSGWVNVPLDTEAAPLELVRDLIEESYRIVAPKRLLGELDP
jgi:predicted DNA-binding protein (MmcQ/YjbR family)